MDPSWVGNNISPVIPPSHMPVVSSGLKCGALCARAVWSCGITLIRAIIYKKNYFYFCDIVGGGTEGTESVSHLCHVSHAHC